VSATRRDEMQSLACDAKSGFGRRVTGSYAKEIL
jgi:hypothetical protein